MDVIRKSQISGIQNTMNLNITIGQLRAYDAGGIPIQEAFPQLNAGEREFIKTGITPTEWDDMFGEEDE